MHASAKQESHTPCPFLLNQLNLHYRSPIGSSDGKKHWFPIQVYGQDGNGLCTRGDTAAGFNCCAHTTGTILGINGRRDLQSAIVRGFLKVFTTGGDRARGAAVGLRNLRNRRPDYQPAANVIRRISRVIPYWMP